MLFKSAIISFCRRRGNEDKENRRRSDDDDDEEYHRRIQQSDSDDDGRSYQRKERSKYDSERYRDRERYDKRRRRSDDDSDSDGRRDNRRKRREHRSDRRRRDTPPDDERHGKHSPVEKQDKDGMDKNTEQGEAAGTAENKEKIGEVETSVKKKANANNPLLTRTGKLHNVDFVFIPDWLNQP